MILRLTIIVLLLCSSALAQSAGELDFLRLSPSVQANGAGQVGALYGGNQSFHYNPATLGHLAPDQMSFSANLRRSGSWRVSDFQSLAVSADLSRRVFGDEPYSIGVACYHLDVEKGHYAGDLSDEADVFSVGVGVDWKFDVAVGFTYKDFSYGNDLGGHAYDIGLFITKELTDPDRDWEPGIRNRVDCKLQLGFAYNNLGPRANAQGDNDGHLLPKIRRADIGIEFTYGDEWIHWLSFKPGFEWRTELWMSDVRPYQIWQDVDLSREPLARPTGTGDEFTVICGEIGIAETLFLRGSSTNEGGSVLTSAYLQRYAARSNSTSYGLSISTVGLKKLFLSDWLLERHDRSLLGHVKRRLNVEFSFARTAERFVDVPYSYIGVGKDDVNRYSIDITY